MVFEAKRIGTRLWPLARKSKAGSTPVRHPKVMIQTSNTYR